MPSTHGPMSSKSRTLLYDACFGALYGALMFALKMAMASLPNIEPVTLLVLVAGCCLGKKGFLAICVYIVCELLVWGAGVWNMGYVWSGRFSLTWPMPAVASDRSGSGVCWLAFLAFPSGSGLR